MASRDAILDSRAIIPQHVVTRQFQAETLMLNLETGTYHGVTEVGARALEIARESGGSLRRVVEQLATEYQADVETISADVAALCAELSDRGLLELVPA